MGVILRYPSHNRGLDPPLREADDMDVWASVNKYRSGARTAYTLDCQILTRTQDVGLISLRFWGIWDPTIQTTGHSAMRRALVFVLVGVCLAHRDHKSQKDIEDDDRSLRVADHLQDRFPQHSDHLDRSQNHSDDLDRSQGHTDRLKGSQRRMYHLDRSQRRLDHLNGSQSHTDHLDRSQRLLDHLHGSQSRTDHLDRSQRRTDHLEGSQRRTDHLDGSQRRTDHLEGSQRRTDHLVGSQRRTDHFEGSHRRLDHLDRSQRRTDHLDRSPPDYLDRAHLLDSSNGTSDFSAIQISQMNSNFGFNLYRRMANKHDHNIIFSPLSVSFNLASLMVGSRGDSYNELLTGLNLEALKSSKRLDQLPNLLKELRDGIRRSDGYDLELGSLSFVHHLFPLHDEFVNETRDYFDMEYRSLDFHNREAKNIIKDFIIKKSKGKVTELMDEIDPQTKMILLDFISFKGKWQVPFNPDLTTTDSFFVNKYNSVKVPMMYKTDEVASMTDNSLSCMVLNLPYRGGAHMLVVMPVKGGDFDVLEDKLSMEIVTTWLKKMKTRKTDVFFPKFRLDQKYKLKSTLEEMGIRDVFTGKANFTGMTDERNLMLSKITQRAVMDVDEIGTESVAVTETEMVAYCFPYTIRVNHPFMFMIFNENYKSLLFIGRVNNPSES
ncbi:protein Z-dependent protease inhibitor [Phyllobates terribilis]|uniref:protein Z-dependent protease inhibitor n=1 Tax=Phyllobates terribilis TaxID=111132 RepID=UPI003CCB391D